MINYLPRNETESLRAQFSSCRNHSINLCDDLSDEDIQAQSMPDASPLKWHLAHTTWAFETFVLKPHCPHYQVFDKDYEYLFNSYYNAIGAQFPRPQRGLLTRPSRETIMAYRQYVDQAIESLIDGHLAFLNPDNEGLHQLLLLMINHEQQHQELMLTDLKHLLSINPCSPVYRDIERLDTCQMSDAVTFEAGIYPIGHRDEGFYFDNEGPRHQFYASRFALHSNLVSNRDYLAFVEDGGYQLAQHWLSEAWQKINQAQITQPFYWRKQADGWFEYTLGGKKPLDLDRPVSHVSYFEANAYANWRGLRLPTEQEWEIAARSDHPGLNQLFNQLWQWTSSSYCAYPGFKPVDGAIGEYNGKFMVNQYVLRGGSIATPDNHIRPSYRNFFYPDARWQFSGIRLAETL
jgi:ergothioneine biosynthesis protein EgtB